MRRALLLALLAVCAAGIGAQTCGSCWDERPPSQEPLAESHPRLARPPDASAHAPEQVHLSFAGPSSYTVTWMTYPLSDPNLEEAVGAVQKSAAASGRRLAAAAVAGAQPHLAVAEAADELETDSLERRKHRRKTKRTCQHVVAAGGRSVVQYGTQAGAYEHTVESSDPVACYASGAYLSGAIHRVQFGAGDEGPVPANTTVFYRVGDPDRGWSGEFSFRTSPLVGQAALPYRLGVIGDLGQSDHSTSTLDHLLVSNPGSLILTGDLSYADGYQPRWDTWQRMVQPFTATQVWMYCVGNHEIELTNGRKDFLAYETRFSFPYRQSLSPSKLYYSYDVAGAHVVMLGSYAPYDTASEQYAWLVRDLAGVDRARTPWVVAVQHAPWYNSNYAHQGEGDAMRDSMEELLYQHGVDFMFSGHVHAYERHYRVFKGKLDDCAPVHINIGDGGNKEGPDKKYYPQPKYSAFREPSFGHGTLDLLDATHAEWRWHRNQDDGPETADAVSVVRDPNCKSLAAARLAALWQGEQQVQEAGSIGRDVAGHEERQQEALLEQGFSSQRSRGGPDAGAAQAGEEQQQQGQQEEAAAQQVEQQQAQQEQGGAGAQAKRHGCLWHRAVDWLAGLTRQLFQLV